MQKGHIQEGLKGKIGHRLKILQGQLEALESHVENNAYCMDIINLSRSIQASLKSFDALMLENHLRSHIVNDIKKGNEDRAIAELLKIYDFSEGKNGKR
jgi:DNA-binding FrmR family transcriptional regulator